MINKKSNFLLQMKNIRVVYGENKVLNGIDFDLYKGEIHALVGDYESGKSSLVKLLSGVVKKKEGEIFFEGKKIDNFTPKIAIKNRIGIVYQNLNIMPSLNAIENIFTGYMIRNRFGLIKHKQMYKMTNNLFKELNFDIDIELPTYKLNISQRYMINFARILMMNPKIMILDELSTKLSSQIMKNVFRVLFNYKKKGVGIIYISQNIEDILKLADRVTILKNGYRRGTEEVKNLNMPRLFQLRYPFIIDNEKLSQNKSKLFLITRYLENIIQHFPIGVIILDANGIIQIMNYAAIEILDYKEGNITDISIKEILDQMNFERKDEIVNMIYKRKIYSWEEITIGANKLCKVELFPLKDEDATFLGTSILIQDISIDHYLKDYMIQSEKMASVAELAVGVAHEINNPLFIIKNYIEVLKDIKINKNGKIKLSKIEKELQRITQIIKNLLSFSRMNELPERKINLVSIIEEVLILLQHKLLKKKINLKKNINDNKIEIKGDENRLKQLFINLINNGIEAVLDYGTIKIDISIDSNNDFVEISITDNGYGIPDDIKNNIFNPFFTTKLNKINTGLGLSICQHIIEEHNGVISFSSIPGKKTKFIVCFPLGPA